MQIFFLIIKKFLGYSQGLFTLISFSSFVLFLILTLIILTVRFFLKCKKQSQQLKTTRELFDNKKLKNTSKLKKISDLKNVVQQQQKQQFCYLKPPLPPQQPKMNGIQIIGIKKSDNLNNINHKNNTFCDMKIPVNVLTSTKTTATNNHFKLTPITNSSELKQSIFYFLIIMIFLIIFLSTKKRRKPAKK